MRQDHVRLNRTSWDADAPDWVERGRRAWGAEEPTWGIWGNPESELGLLEGVEGMDAVVLGCGTGYECANLARRGARPVGLDNSFQQLRTSTMLQQEFGLSFPLVHADAERSPFADATFDLALSEYGAAIWCDPYRWIPEAARILRPGGRLVFVAGSALLMLCFPTDDDEAPADSALHRDYFGMHRFEWHDADGVVDSVEFHLPHGEMIRVLHSCGFEVEELLEPPPPVDADEHGATWVPVAWAERWPSVEVWKARKLR